jgi:hypothetical protein
MKETITSLLLLCGIFSFAQEDSEKNTVDAFIKGFNLKMDTVHWLCEYDNIAWWTSDSVYATPKEEQEKLGSEWFCFKKGSIWHAVYGKYKDNRFDMVYHYEVDTNQLIKRVYEQIDSLILNSNCRAIVNGSKFLNDYPDSIKVRFNQYIRRNSDNTLSLWFLPAFTTNSIAVYGGEFYYLFDSTGNNLIAKTEYSQGYKGFKPDLQKEIWLNYETRDEPTLGSIFFIWYYRKYFDRIVVNAKKFKSTLFHDKEKYYWVHAVKD